MSVASNAHMVVSTFKGGRHMDIGCDICCLRRPIYFMMFCTQDVLVLVTKNVSKSHFSSAKIVEIVFHPHLLTVKCI